ncbi:hypothetical protein FHX75_14295 [Micromonospora palomenae]|uniref:Uncharacterized protein n=1 Tax=Micromonospora palomenae TaxID=1461247 RepID=A0A561VK15_9ACTN|nr:hypothetical protein FHX75_14295 [Micromonospora palomenae]
MARGYAGARHRAVVGRAVRCGGGRGMVRTAVGVSSTERARVPDQVDVHASGEEKLIPLRHEPMLPVGHEPGQRPSRT